MKNIITIILALVILGIILIIARKPKDSPVTEIGNIVGCYVLRIEKNVYTLNIQSQNNSSVSGTLEYDNFQFDDSSGTFVGTYENNILLGYYSFTSEGMDSVTQHIFKRSGNDFIQGSGEYTTVNNREVFSDPSAITWDQNRIFIKSPCI